MKRYILTGAPGCGKTAILRQLELAGYGVIEEAATDVIALLQARGIEDPWTDPDFVESVAQLQKLRLERASSAKEAVQFHDRSVICTRALAAYLGVREPEILTREAVRVAYSGIFEKTVFFVRNLGFVRPTAARRISFEESLRFERMHEEAYRKPGFELVYVESGSLAERFAKILQVIEAPSSS